MSLQFLIDDLCANFTQGALYSLIEALLLEGRRTVAEIALAIADRDRSLDPGSARALAEAAIEALAESGVVAVEDGLVYRCG